MATKKSPKTKAIVKTRSKKSRKWNEVEDFYVRGNIGLKTINEIAEALGRVAEEVASRITELGIDLQAAYAERYLNDMKVMGADGKPVEGAYAMTAARAVDTPIPSKSGGQRFLEHYRNSIAPARRS